MKKKTQTSLTSRGGDKECAKHSEEDTKNAYLVRNYRAFIYLLLSLALYVSLLVLNSDLNYVGFNYFTSQVRRFADAMLFALPVFFLYKKRFLFPYIILVNLYLLSNVWYYRNYGTLMPMTSYIMVENLQGLGPSIWSSIRWSDWWILFPSICFMVYYGASGRMLSKGRLWENWKYIGGSILMILVIILPSYIIHPRTEYAHPYSLYTNEVVRAFRQFGFINYWSYQANYLRGCTSEEKDYAIEFMKEQVEKQSFAPLVKKHQKNLILILVESLQAWPINLSIDGREVTPYLNSLIKKDSVLYFSKVLPQVKGGRSSDAQLLLNTGLLPIATGAAASLYGTHEYPSLPKALAGNGYTSVSFLCDDKAYWNQEATSKSYGFMKLYDRMAKGNPMVQADENLFKYSLPILEKEKQPFYAQLVTFSGHDAVKTDFESHFDHIKFDNEIVKLNLIITEYVDKCIGRFIEALKRDGLYENSIIVITGDHDSIAYNLYEGREKCNLEDRYVPLLILNAPLYAECDKVIGQSDIYPSLLDMMGVGGYSFHGLGESVFRNQSDCAIYHTGEMAGNCKNDSIISNKRERWKISDILIKMDYFKRDDHDYIAHGGGSIDGHTYTNSKEAVLRAIENGSRYIEIDLSLTSDNQLVATHDWVTFNQQTDYLGDTAAISLSEFKSRKIYGKYTPLDYQDIDSIWHAYPYLNLVTDKISDVNLLDKFFHRLKNRMLVEAFSFEDYVALKRLGFILCFRERGTNLYW